MHLSSSFKKQQQIYFNNQLSNVGLLHDVFSILYL